MQKLLHHRSPKEVFVILFNREIGGGMIIRLRLSVAKGSLRYKHVEKMVL